MSGGDAWIWGRHPVLEGLRASQVMEVVVAEGHQTTGPAREVREVAGVLGIPVHEMPAAEIERLTGSRHTQGVAARAGNRPPPADLADVLQLARDRAVAPFLLVLDQVQDPQNFGSLLRSANAAGIQAVILPERRSAPLSGTVAKASAGASSYVTIIHAPNLARSLRDLREQGIWIVGLDEAADQYLFDVDLTLPLALVVGSEGSGMRRLTRENCDYLVRLPMLGQVESLNAAVAGSIAMYEAVRQRMAAGSTTD